MDDLNYISMPGSTRPQTGVGVPVETFENLACRKDLGIDATPADVLDCYFKYLCDASGLNGGEIQISRDKADHTYFSLAWTLHHIYFYGGVPNDNNRDADGKNLRKKFSHLHSSFKDYEVLNLPRASVLEVIFALAERIEQSERGPDDDDRVKDWVMLMLRNLKIDMYTDSVWDSEAYFDVIDKIEVMLSRNYDKNGNGSLFPKISPLFKNKDWRKLEIWYQMEFFFRELS